MTFWDTLVLGLVIIAGALLGWISIRRGARWWELLSLSLGLVVALAALASPLDRWGRDGLLSAHLGQHLLLGDVAAALILLGLPPTVKRQLGSSLERHRLSSSRRGHQLAKLTSPMGALVVWALLTYLWLLPPVHRAAVPQGAVHAIDHVAFLGLGFLIWLAAFDPRRARPWRRALREGGLPWWGRHIFAMLSRAALLPPAIAIWLAEAGSYHDLTNVWPFSISRAEDQELGASVMIGFEMILFGMAIVLGFIFVIVASNRSGPKREPW